MPYILQRRRFLRTAATIAVGSATLPLLTSCDPQPRPVSIGLVTDSHYADRPPSGTRYYRQAADKMRAAAEFFNGQDLDFAIHLGDFKDETENPSEAETLTFLDTIESAFATYEGDRYHVLGNHDVDSITKAQFQAGVTNSDVDPEATYYSFLRNGYRFVILDACFNEDGNAYAPGNFTWDKAYVNQDQLDWLKDELSPPYPTIVFVHQLLDDQDEPGFVIGNAAEVRSILEASGNVLAVFQGHRHEELHHEINGIHYYTFNAMVDEPGLENNSFAIIHVGEVGEAIRVDGYQRAGDAILHLG